MESKRFLQRFNLGEIFSPGAEDSKSREKEDNDGWWHLRKMAASSVAREDFGDAQKIVETIQRFLAATQKV